MNKIKKKRKHTYMGEGENNLSEDGVRKFNNNFDKNVRRNLFNLPKIKGNGIVIYDEDDDNYNENEEKIRQKKKSKKEEKREQKLKSMLYDMNKKKTKIIKSSIDEEIIKISNKMNNYKDIKNIIADICNNIMGDQTMYIDKFELLFYILQEAIKRKKKIINKESPNSISNNYSDNSKDEYKTKYNYFEDISNVASISICTVLKCITPSYKIINMNNDSNSNSSNNLSKGKQNNSSNKFSKIIENVNIIEEKIVKYFKKFCNILKDKIKHNTIVYVNLLCEIITVNLHLSKSENLYDLLIIYSNSHTYNNNNIKYNKSKENDKIIKKNNNSEMNIKILCMKCLNTIKEIIDNDSNLSITIYLIDYFVNNLFKNNCKISSDLLRIFSKIKISEKKINAKLYSQDVINNISILDKDNNNNEEINAKTNICGELKIIEKNTEKILENLFFVYLCVLREHNKYSTIFVKNVLYAISNYAPYINKLLMDDVFQEIKALAIGDDKKGFNKNDENNKNNENNKNSVVSSNSLKLTAIHIFLEILNKTNDNIYIDCSWIAQSLIDLLDSDLSHFYVGSSCYLFENTNFIYTSFLDTKNNNYLIDASNNIESQESKYNFPSELLYCIHLLLITKNFTTNYNTFKSSNNQLLAKIVYKLYNVSIHSDYIISFCFLKLIKNILDKYPLVKSIIEMDGITISIMDGNLSVFFQNIYFHSFYFNNVSSLAFDISLNDSNDIYKTEINKYMNINNIIGQNKIINYNLSLREKNIIDKNKIFNYNSSDIFYKNNKYSNLDNNKFKHTNNVSYNSSTNVNKTLSLNFANPHMLMAIDFVEIVFSPYNEFIKSFQINLLQTDKHSNTGSDADNGNSHSHRKVRKITKNKKSKKKKKKNRKK
ncbi:conserved Plasmodium protein, unknown function [Plasmodium yoelii]|uniref:NOC3 domain-containing protein n=2 Tax=Plasmodium yoelii TaxID=5861 RepID=A0AAF0B830_PLAYO|nr:conserved Plasmodium protein, unknown function [Plasmodium yoelii]WBY60045.1 NOC3 domain-containing protein [Plasmodium yoelii yoelii]CDU19969.1 conserved Plasmodium protein, unknown function [Plasmodium yoelii]VTZ80727.1 conserved Plasmodium protein, unknown function [Plasmodium yoelii]|eukprot:XP_022813618.1 conserved Plasmodium protein, unknown function [Plasmodium yoelii]